MDFEEFRLQTKKLKKSVDNKSAKPYNKFRQSRRNCEPDEMLM